MTNRAPCCVNDECDILCCIQRGNCPYSKKAKRSTLFSFSKDAYCYNADSQQDIRLWENRAPGAVGNDPCKDIPFMRVFWPTKSVRRTDIGMLIFPGGGYGRLTNFREQAPVAEYFANKLGITTFVLYYRLVQTDGTYRYPVPMWDGQRAFRYVRYNAARFNVNPERIGILGFSAGGHLGVTIAHDSNQSFNLSNSDIIDKATTQPKFLGLGYPVISMDPNQYASNGSLERLLYGYVGSERKYLEDFLSSHKHVNSNTPPTFIFESMDDRRVSAENSVLFVKALENAGIPDKALIVEHGEHGAGLAENEPAERIWSTLFYNWLIEQKLVTN